MSDTLEINVRRTSVRGNEAIESHAETTAVSAPAVEQPAMPFAVPRSQLYFWTAKWQEDEGASLDEMNKGEGREFECAADAIRWLLDPEDD
jgi:hypothetical protein